MAEGSRVLLCDQFNQFPEGLTTVAAAILLLRREFGRAAAAIGNEKYRVIAEATITLPRMQNGSAPLTFCDQRPTGRLDKGCDAMKRSRAIVLALECREQIVIICLIVTIRARVTCGVNARCATQFVNRET